MSRPAWDRHVIRCHEYELTLIALMEAHPEAPRPAQWLSDGLAIPPSEPLPPQLPASAPIHSPVDHPLASATPRNPCASPRNLMRIHAAADHPHGAA